MLPRRTLLLLAACSSLVAGCRFFRPINPNAPTAAEAGAASPGQSGKPAEAAAQRERGRERLTDANIAAMALALNNTDISYARLAPSRAERDDIRQFAQRMLTDHTGVNGMVEELMRKLDLAPEDNIASLDMRDESATKRDMMRDLSGYAFDSTYIENEITYHRKFLAELDNVMIPGARNAELRALLTRIRPAVAGHLAHAEQVRANVIARK